MFVVVKTLELPPFSDDRGEELWFRIEILRDCSQKSRFFARLYRWDSYELRPADQPPLTPPLTSHEQLLVQDLSWQWQPAESAQEAAEVVLSYLRERLPGAAIPAKIAALDDD